MRVLKPAGNGAAARKYDLLSALGTMALAKQPAEQRLVLRLIVAITARYNWASDTLAVAQSDLARMWSVDERTVKRMMAEYRGRGWLKVKRQATRGRVAEYGLGIEDLLIATRADWSRVGSDLEARLTPQDPPEPSSTIVQFPVTATEVPSGDVWPHVLELLTQGDTATAKAWLQGVTEEGLEDFVLRLSTKGRYQANYLRTHLAARILGAAKCIDPQITGIKVSAEVD